METFESRNRIVQGTGVNKSISPDKPQQTANTSVAKQRRRKKKKLKRDNSKFVPFWMSSSLIKTLLHQAAAESPLSVAEYDELAMLPQGNPSLVRKESSKCARH